MGRNSKISKEEALIKSMNLFWSRGYTATTMDDIQEATGLQRGSIYSYFKTKENLFMLALEKYQLDVVAKRRSLISQTTSAKKAIELFFEILIDHSINNKNQPGCLNTNSAVELSVIDDEFALLAKKGLVSWEKFWIEILEKSVQQKEISPKSDLQSLARFIIATTQGVNVISKVNPDRKYLNQIVQNLLSTIK